MKKEKRATMFFILYIHKRKKMMATLDGIEPPLIDSKSIVFPLNERVIYKIILYI